MQIPPEIVQCVCFVEGSSPHGGSVGLVGTAFFVCRPLEGAHPSVAMASRATYIVTAKHVLRDADNRPLENLRLRINTEDATDVIEVPFGEWKEHPHSDTAVASLFDAPARFDYKAYPITEYARRDTFWDLGVTPGDEVVITGLLWQHPGEPRNTPIVRVGHLAALPLDSVALGTGAEGAVLVEVLSFGGLSGSPAFLHVGDFRRQDLGRGELVPAEGPWGESGGNILLGIVHGFFQSEEPHTTSQELLNTGITAVVPAARIAELIDQEPDFVHERGEYVKRLNKKRPTIEPASRPRLPEYTAVEDLTRKLVRVSTKEIDEKRNES